MRLFASVSAYFLTAAILNHTFVADRSKLRHPFGRWLTHDRTATNHIWNCEVFLMLCPKRKEELFVFR
jgi:hypothetical protein